MKLFQCLAHYASQSNDYESKMFDAVCDLLPRGSGLDHETNVTGNAKKLVLITSFHSMDVNGYYDGWTDIKIIITPSLVNMFDMKIIARFPARYRATKEYLSEVFNDALNANVDITYVNGETLVKLNYS